MNNISILIIDDEPVYLELMVELLQNSGYENIFSENDPLKVINILKKNNIDLVLLDMYMPEMNGLQVLEQIHLSFPQVPVIMITAVDEIEVALEAIKLGAYEYITKPIETERLFLTIRRAIELRYLELELDAIRGPSKIDEQNIRASATTKNISNNKKIFLDESSLSRNDLSSFMENKKPKLKSLKEAEKDYINYVLYKVKGNIETAASVLEINVETLKEKIGNSGTNK